MTTVEDAVDRYIFVNLDKRQYGPIFRQDKNGRISLYDLSGIEAAMARIMNPSLGCFVPGEWLPTCSSDQRHHLGGLDMPPELHALILEHVQDADTVVAFACAHNLLAESALRRLCEMLAGEPDSLWGTWAGDRIVTLSTAHPTRNLPEHILTEIKERGFPVHGEEEGGGLLKHLRRNFSKTWREDSDYGNARCNFRGEIRETLFKWQRRALGLPDWDDTVHQVFDKNDCARAIRYLGFSECLPVTKTDYLTHAMDVGVLAECSKVTSVAIDLERHQYVRLRHVTEMVDHYRRDVLKEWSFRNSQLWTDTQSICFLARTSWSPLNRMRITLLNRIPAFDGSAEGGKGWQDISEETVNLIVGSLKSMGPSSKDG